MNKIYRLVWNHALGLLQVATELSKSPGGLAGKQGRSQRTLARNRLAQACAIVLLAGTGSVLDTAQAAKALPATFIVTQSADNGDPSVVGSLSWAIAQANQDPGSTIDVQLTSGNSISETGTLPALMQPIALTDASDLTILGTLSGMDGLTWTGSGTLTLANASLRAGVILQSGSLDLQLPSPSASGSVFIIGGFGSAGSTPIRGGSATINGGAGEAGVSMPSAQSVLTIGGSNSVMGGVGGLGGYSAGGVLTGGGGGTGGAGVASTGSVQNDGSVYGGRGGSGGRFGGAGAQGGSGITGAGFTLTNSGVTSGGLGGGGGYAYGATAGGAGGQGGAGVSGSGFTITNSGFIWGGLGGVGGPNTSGSGSVGGAGGSGGAGVIGSGFTLVNTNEVLGGDGSQGGAGYSYTGGVVLAAPGSGGAGVVAEGGSTVINAGLIGGGLSFDGVRADAIDFSGGGNTLVIEANARFQGNVVSTSPGGDILQLGGDVNATNGNVFDLSSIVAQLPTIYTGTAQFYGFSQFEKTGASTWTLILTGGTAPQASWSVLDGTLQVGNATTMGLVTGANGAPGQAGATAITLASGTSLGISSNASQVIGGRGGMGASYGANGAAGGAAVIAGASSIANQGQIVGGGGGYGAQGVTTGGSGGLGAIGGMGVDGQGTTVVNAGYITGGYGGQGGRATGRPSSPGQHGPSGGAGGAGAAALGGTGITLTNSGDISGGYGGYGGSGGTVIGNSGGAGGAGGAGVTGSQLTLSNSGMIQGGIGGYGGLSGYGGGAGAGGDGINAQNFSLANTGSVTGGVGGVANRGSFFAGNAGAGGAGLYGSQFTLTNEGQIHGGNGGQGVMAFATAGTAGAGGAAIAGSAFVVTNTTKGLIAGGNGGSPALVNGCRLCAPLAPGAGSPAPGGLAGASGGAGIVGTGFTLTNQGTVTGGYGTAGGYGGPLAIPNNPGATPPPGQSTTGGLGGAGGAGVSGSGFTVVNSGKILGAVGGAGGNAPSGYAAGAGGTGGAAVSGAGIVLTNTGTLQGGDGGMPGTSTSNGSAAAGAGGAGVVSTGASTITNAGLIAGGLASLGTGAQADAIDFSGGGNTLVLEAGATFTGNVVSTSGSTNGGDTLVLGGDTNASSGNVFALNQLGAVGSGAAFQGFTHLGKAGASTWTLQGSWSAPQDWTITDGTLTGNTSNLTGNIVFAPSSASAAPAVAFDESGMPSATYAGSISGAGALQLVGGALTLTGTNTYSGGTSIQSGTLTVGSGGTQGTLGTGAILDNGTLVFNRSGTLVENDAIGGAGSLIKQGAGALILNGANTYTGATTVTAGLLEVGDASHAGAKITGNVTLVGGTTLRGHGTIVGSVTNNGGTVMPGGSIGVLHVQGNLVQSATSTLALEVSPNATPGTGYSQLQVSGTATLAGTLGIQVDPGTYAFGTSYDLVHAGGGVHGTFSQTNYNPAFAVYLTPQISYTANDVMLVLQPNAAAFSNAFPNYAATTGLSIEQDFATVLGAMDDGTDLSLSARNGAWAEGIDSSGTLASTHYTIHGGAAGVGHALSSQWTVGVAIAGSNTVTTLDPMSVTAKPLGGFVYGIFRQGGWRLAGSVGAGRLREDSTRNLIGFAQSEQSTGHGHFVGAALRGSYSASLGGYSVRPYVGVDYQRNWFDATTEQGLPMLALQFGRLSQRLVHTEAGVRFARTWRANGQAWKPWVSLGAEGWGGTRQPTLAETLANYTQMAVGSGLPNSAFSAGAGVTWHADAWDAALGWHGSWGTQYHGTTGMLQVRYRW